MKPHKQVILPVLVGILLAVCLEGVMAFWAAGRGYGERDRVLSLSPAVIDGYEINGDQYRVSSDIPKILFYTDEPIGFLDIYFKAPIDGDMNVILYYKEERGAAFDYFKRVERYLMDGTTRAVIPLPPGEWRDIRLDIRGDFCLDRFEAGFLAPPGEATALGLLHQVNPLRLLFLTGIGAAGGFAAAGALKKKRKERTGSRIIYLDGIRALAAVLVIAVHVAEPVIGMVPEGSLVRRVLRAGVTFGFTSNLLFVFLSGALLLSWREESVGEYVRKRVLKVVVPLIVYGIFYIRFLCASKTDILSWLSYGLRAFFSGQIKAGPHLWLVYELMGLYLIAIFFRYMFRAMPESIEKALACLILGLLTIRTLSLYTGRSFGISSFLSDWPGIFLMGYLLTRDWMRRYDGFWLAGGCLAYIGALLLSGFRTDFQAIIANCSIFMMLMSGAVFTAFMHCERVLYPLRGILAFISRYSYSVILVHFYVLNGWIYNGWFNSELPRVVRVIAPILTCAALSLVMAVLMDHTAVAALERLANAAIRAAGLKSRQKGKRRAD